MLAAVSAAQDQIQTLQKQLALAQVAIDSLTIAVNAAKAAQEGFDAERAGAARTLAIAETAIKQQGDLIVMYQGAIKTLQDLVALSLARVDALEKKIDKANGRTAILGIVLTVAGVIVGLKR